MTTRFFLSLFLLLTASCNLSSQMPKGKNVQIKIELDSTLNYCEQTIYLHHYEDNERIIDDSVTIKKGQKEVSLYAYIQEERWLSILFSEKGPIDWFVVLTPNSYVETSISESDGISPSKPIKGGYANNEYVRTANSSHKLHQEKKNLYAELASPGLAEDKSKSITEKIAGIDARLDTIQMNLVEHSLSAHNTINALKYFKDKVNKDSLITLCNIAKRRFPNNKRIEGLIRPVHINYPPESENSKAADKLITGIIQKRLADFTKFNHPRQAEKTEVDIKNISLLSDKNEQVSVSQLKGKIILIDFWASWCIPCLEEIPYIRQIQKLYGDRIAICLISIDKKHQDWRKAIKNNRLHDFINLTATDAQGNMEKTIQKMDIKAIPYNLILNENYEIIAKDIHGKELLLKIDSLIKQ